MQPRQTPQQRQEEVSRGQLHARLSKFGWSPASIYPDRGEDFLVRILDADVPSGLAFYIQLKSTQDLNKHRLKDGNLSYSLEVKDLVYWSALCNPVFIMLWDVNKEIGCWVNVEEAIKQLDSKHTPWRSKKKVSIRIPASNTTADESLNLMRHIVADYYLPLYARGRELTIKAAFAFPNTPKDRAVYEALQRHFEAGDPVEIDGRYIQQLQFSDWWMRLYGETDPSKGSLTLSSISTQTSFPARLEVINPTGDRFVIPYIDLRALKGGSEEITFSNQHQPVMLHFWFVLRRSGDGLSLHVELNPRGGSVTDICNTLSFMSALARGGRFKLTFLKVDSTFEGTFPANQVREPDAEFADLLFKLCRIQKETEQDLTLKEWEISGEEARKINMMIAIIETGRITYPNSSIKFDLNKQAIANILADRRVGDKIFARLIPSNASLRLLDAEINLGRVIRHVEGKFALPIDDPEAMLANMDDNDRRDIEIVDANIVDEFIEWVEKLSAT